MKSTTARRTAALTLALTLASPLALAACSGSNSGTNGTTTAATSSSPALGELKPGGTVDKAKFFEITKAAAAANPTYAFTTKVGDGGSELSSTGVVDNSDPNNRKRQITLKDDKGESQLVIAGGQVYMKNANLLGGKWLQSPLNPALSEVLGGASDRIQADQGLVQSITYVGDEDVSGTKTRHFTLTVDPTKATAAPSTGAAPATGTASSSATAPSAGTGGTTAAGAATTTVEYWLDDKNRTRKMKHSVAGVPTVTTYDKWGEAVTITVPSPDQVTSTATPPATPASPAPSASASTR